VDEFLSQEESIPAHLKFYQNIFVCKVVWQCKHMNYPMTLKVRVLEFVCGCSAMDWLICGCPHLFVHQSALLRGTLGSFISGSVTEFMDP
jgi:hypothetical protein